MYVCSLLVNYKPLFLLLDPGVINLRVFFSCLIALLSYFFFPSKPLVSASKSFLDILIQLPTHETVIKPLKP